MSVDIPKIIWQTHNYKFNNLPDHFKMTSKTWVNLNPNWEYRYVDHIERKRVVSAYPDLFKIYQTANGVNQADIWRYIVTYEHGGVYADMDSVCVKPLDYFLENVDDYEMYVHPTHHSIYFQIEDYTTVNSNYAIKKNSKIMFNILKQYSKKGGYPFAIFNEEVLKSRDVSYDFSAAYHDDIYKTTFKSNFMVNDYGDKMLYEKYLKLYDLSII